jgi:hypothetical protein
MLGLKNGFTIKLTDDSEIKSFLIPFLTIKIMNKFKTFYLDFVLIYGTIMFLSTINIIIGNLTFGEKELLIIISVGLIYAIVKLFWDNYNAEKIAELENEIKQLKEEIAKKNSNINH